MVEFQRRLPRSSGSFRRGAKRLKSFGRYSRIQETQLDKFRPRWPWLQNLKSPTRNNSFHCRTAGSRPPFAEPDLRLHRRGKSATMREGFVVSRAASSRLCVEPPVKGAPQTDATGICGGWSSRPWRHPKSRRDRSTGDSPFSLGTRILAIATRYRGPLALRPGDTSRASRGLALSPGK